MVFCHSITKQTVDFDTYYSIELVDNYMQRCLTFSLVSFLLSDKKIYSRMDK
jgi:hypothetical protein